MMILSLALLACVPKSTVDDTADTAIDTSVDDTAVDTAIDDTAIDTDTSSSCLVLNPTQVDLVGNTYTAFVAVSGCIDELAATCTSPFSAAPSAAVQGSWIVSVDPSTTAPVTGSCTFASSEGTAELAASYAPTAT